MHIQAKFQEGVFDFFLMQTPEITDGAKTYDFGGKKIMLPNGMFAKSIEVFRSGKIRLWEREAVRGKGSGYSFPSDCELEVIYKPIKANLPWVAGMPNAVKFSSHLRLRGIRNGFLKSEIVEGNEYTATSASYWRGESRFFIVELDREVNADFFEIIEDAQP